MRSSSKAIFQRNRWVCLQQLQHAALKIGPCDGMLRDEPGFGIAGPRSASRVDHRFEKRRVAIMNRLHPRMISIEQLPSRGKFRAHSLVFGDKRTELV
jgi:hypothetical protein